MFHFSLTGSSTALTRLEKPQTGIIALRRPSFLGGLTWQPKGFFFSSCFLVVFFLSILPSLETLVFVDKQQFCHTLVLDIILGVSWSPIPTPPTGAVVPPRPDWWCWTQTPLRNNVALNATTPLDN